MDLKDKKIGFALTGSFCTYEKIINYIRTLVELGANVIPIMSFNGSTLDTRFGKASDFTNQIEEITGKKIINTIQDAEPIGPQNMTDIIVVAPLTR